MDMSFLLCDSSKDDKITRQEMAACAIPAAVDTKEEGILTIYAGGSLVIPSPGAQVPKPERNIPNR